MIEVEKQFQPTDEQLRALLEGAKFLGEKVNHDIYYDYPDYRFFHEDLRLRNRDGSFELKIGGGSGISQELETKEEIQNYLQTSNLEEFVEKNLIPIIDYESRRKKYEKEDFNISVDEMNFGYRICEIELMVENEDQIPEAENKIVNLAKKCNIELKKIHAKRKEYFRLVKPEVYKELYN